MIGWQVNLRINKYDYKFIFSNLKHRFPNLNFLNLYKNSSSLIVNYKKPIIE